MTLDRTFNVSYDSDVDVLYIAKRIEPAVRGTEDGWGIVWRFALDGEAIGATVTDFHDAWDRRRSVLANELSRHFNISDVQAKGVVAAAFEL
jgi:hypothetical protein